MNERKIPLYIPFLFCLFFLRKSEKTINKETTNNVKKREESKEKRKKAKDFTNGTKNGDINENVNNQYLLVPPFSVFFFFVFFLQALTGLEEQLTELH